MKIRDKLYKKWLVTLNLVFLIKYKLYQNKITIINKIYRDNFYNDILTKSDSTKKMWDNINLLINKKWPSSHIGKLQVDNKHKCNYSGDYRNSRTLIGREWHHIQL